MFENIKKLREIKQNAKNAVNSEYDCEGREIINMTVKNDDGFLSPYGSDSGENLSYEVAEFLDNSVKSLSLRNGVLLKIKSNAIDEDEKQRYQKAIKNHYGAKVLESERQMKRNSVASLIMLLLAVAVLTVCVVLEIRGVNSIALELIDIVAWVFMWEAVDLFFLERGVLKTEQLRACRLYDARVSFEMV